MKTDIKKEFSKTVTILKSPLTDHPIGVSSWSWGLVRPLTSAGNEKFHGITTFPAFQSPDGERIYLIEMARGKHSCTTPLQLVTEFSPEKHQLDLQKIYDKGFTVSLLTSCSAGGGTKTECGCAPSPMYPLVRMYSEIQIKTVSCFRTNFPYNVLYIVNRGPG